MIKINLEEIAVTDLNGVPVRPEDLQDLPKQIGNLIFINAMSIEVSDIARALHAGNTVVVSEHELAEIVEVVKTNLYYKPFVTLQIVEYLKNLLKNTKKEKGDQ